MDSSWKGITEDGQPYVDEPIYAQPKAERMTPIAESLAHIFGHVQMRTNKMGLPVLERTDVRKILLGHERVKLRWLKRNPDGSLSPR